MKHVYTLCIYYVQLSNTYSVILSGVTAKNKVIVISLAIYIIPYTKIARSGNLQGMQVPSITCTVSIIASVKINNNISYIQTLLPLDLFASDCLIRAMSVTNRIIYWPYHLVQRRLEVRLHHVHYIVPLTRLYDWNANKVPMSCLSPYA